MRAKHQLIDAYVAWQDGRAFSPRTTRRRRTTLRQFAELIHPRPFDAATLDDAETWLRSKASANTRHAYRSDLRGFYGWAVQRGHLDRNPVAALDPVRVPKGLPRPFRGDQFLHAFATADGPVQLMVGFGGFAGLRCAEIAALDYADLWTHTTPPLVVVRRGKGGKDRTVPMHPELVAALGRPPSAGPVFPGRSPEAVSKAIKRHLRRCGIDGVPHQLRHTFGTSAMAASRGDVVLVKTLMGHEDMNTTLRYSGWAGGPAAEVIRTMFDEAA